MKNFADRKPQPQFRTIVVMVLVRRMERLEIIYSRSGGGSTVDEGFRRDIVAPNAALGSGGGSNSHSNNIIDTNHLQSSATSATTSSGLKKNKEWLLPTYQGN